MRTPIPVMPISGGNLDTLIFASHACQKMADLCFSQLIHEFGLPNPFSCIDICVRAALCDFFLFSQEFMKKVISFVAKNSKIAHFGHSAAVSAMALASTQPRLETLRRQPMLLAVVSTILCLSLLQELDFQPKLLD